MSKLACFAAGLAAILALAAVGAANEKPSADAILAALRKGFAGVNDCRATVTLTVKGPQVSINEMKMTLYYKKPNKVHIEAERGIAMFPRGALFGNPVQELGNGGRADYVRSERKLGVDCYVLRLTAPGARPGAHATVWVDKKHTVVVAAESTGTADMKTSWRYQTIDDKYYLPVQMNAELHPQAGPDTAGVIKSTIRFSNYRINKGVSDRVFESKPPTQDSDPHLRRRYRK